MNPLQQEIEKMLEGHFADNYTKGRRDSATKAILSLFQRREEELEEKVKVELLATLDARGLKKTDRLKIKQIRALIKGTSPIRTNPII